MTTDEMIAVLVAAKHGKLIQARSRSKGPLDGWTDCPFPIWDFRNYEYRAKLTTYYVVIGVFPPELVIGDTFGTAVLLTKEDAAAEEKAMKEAGLTDISIHEIQK